MKKLVLGVTVGGSSRLLDGQVTYFKKLGYEVYLLSPDHFKEKLFCEREGCIHLPVAIEKEISPLKDIKSLYQIIKQLRKVKPDIVNVGTFKMGLLGIIAAWFLRIDNRIYTCRGLRFETEKGLKKKVLILADKVIVFFAKKVIYVSASTLTSAVKYTIANPKKSYVIAKGSSNGVNLSRFRRDAIDVNQREDLIEKLDLKEKLVIGFVGRVSLHKGAEELIHAFKKLYLEYPNLQLVMVGHLECSDAILDEIKNHPNILHVPFQDNVPLYMSLFDIFVLPSWREGFPNVPIQAAAMGVPVIVSDATGCVDAVDKNKNGFVFKTKDEEDLIEKLRKYIVSDQLRKSHGSNGMEWATEFKSEIVWNGIETVYKTN